ncbi:hypothetical protein HK102_005189, partial [Quaeritorhiza haematococci]
MNNTLAKVQLSGVEDNLDEAGTACKGEVVEGGGAGGPGIVQGEALAVFAEALVGTVVVVDQLQAEE